MRIEIKDTLLQEIIIIQTDTNNPDNIIDINWQGNDYAIERLQRSLSNFHGAYGHILHIQETTNVDLYAAVTKLSATEYTIISVDPVPKIRSFKDVQT